MPFVHGAPSRVLLNGGEITTFLNKFDGWPGTGEINETTTFGVPGNSKTFIRGLNTATASLAGFWDGAANAIDATLAPLRTSATDAQATLAPGGSLAVGSRVYASSVLLQDFKTSVPVNNVVSFSATCTTDGPMSAAYSLHDLVAETVTGVGAGFDNGASTANGGQGVFHATVASGTAWTLKVQHSADNVTYADLVTLTSSLVAPGSALVTVPVGTTINRWLRASWTAGSAALTFHISFGRR